MTERTQYPLALAVELDPPHTEGQRRARIVARVKDNLGVTYSEHTLFSEVVYDYPEDGRPAQTLIMRGFALIFQRLFEEG